MPKGRTNQPLVIWVHGQWAGHPEVEALGAAGHTVKVMPLNDADLILHPAAHQWNDTMFDYLPAALTAARKRKREGK